MEFVVMLTGERPMLQHNGRLANPIDSYTRQLSAITGKRKKTDDDLISIMEIEARGACWETPEGLLGLPNAAVWRCIYDAAKAYKRGEDIKRALILEDIVQPLSVGGAFVSCDEYLKDATHIDYRPVKVNNRKTMRARPIVHDWSSSHRFELLDDVIDARALVPILERAGRLVGVGDWRPTYGTFSVEVSS